MLWRNPVMGERDSDVGIAGGREGWLCGVSEEPGCTIGGSLRKGAVKWSRVQWDRQPPAALGKAGFVRL